MTTPGSDPLVAGSPQPEHLVILLPHEARLLLHSLAVFERVLRLGDLTPGQKALLLPPGAGPCDPSADLEMAEVVVDAGETLRRQLE